MSAWTEVDGVVLAIGSWYRVIDGFHTGQVGVLMAVEEGNFGRKFVELVVDEGNGRIRCRLGDVVPE